MAEKLERRYVEVAKEIAKLRIENLKAEYERLKVQRTEPRVDSPEYEDYRRRVYTVRRKISSNRHKINELEMEASRIFAELREHYENQLKP